MPLKLVILGPRRQTFHPTVFNLNFPEHKNPLLIRFIVYCIKTPLKTKYYLENSNFINWSVFG
jgi:hypothetical protein